MSPSGYGARYVALRTAPNFMSPYALTEKGAANTVAGRPAPSPRSAQTAANLPPCSARGRPFP
ncbi:hypothetical protein GCM10012286_16810 [Streptomyces lasiicapitis]|uniref:Uncharacterized protein n=1 Tax=Streptomyces lasiicapitis TaxID=1923961 RepID=A0ABQ2LLT7_9ACTN|nr:hypothetical protein GCM10012286_16810 [Streptomyces lasiicapitis]